jgi:7-carboxy-7-deazaguanine synthase
MGTEDGPDPAQNAVLYANEFRTDMIITDGPDAGRRCAIIRLAGCNLTCDGCDQPSTWGPQPVSRPVRVGVFLDRLNQASQTFPVVRVVITGGEPLLQQEGPALRCLIEGCVDVGRMVHVETNGTTIPAPWLGELNQAGLVRWRVSPKVSGPLSSDPKRRRIYPAALNWFVISPYAEFLFPCQDTTDIDTVRLFCTDYQLNPGRVWIYPMGTDHVGVVRAGPQLAQAALRAGFNVSTRLGVIMMGR